MYSGSDLVGYLLPADGLKDAEVSVELNGPSTLTFTLPLDCPKWEFFDDPHCRVRVDGREFCLLNPIEKERHEVLDGRVEMSETWCLLGRKYITVGETPLAVIALSSTSYGGYPPGSAASALYALLEGTEWTLGTVDVSGKHDLETEKMTVLENVREVQRIWGGWLVWDSVNKILQLRDEHLWQNDSGFEIRYGKNQKMLTKKILWDGVVTKLYPFGEKDLNIGSVNDGVIFLEDYSFTDEVREGIYRWEEIDDPAELKEEAVKYLERMCRPLIQYEAETLDLRTLPGYEHEVFSVGDLVTICDEVLARDVSVRLIAYSYDVIQPWNCSLKLGDPIEVPLQNIADTIAAGKYVDDVLKASKGVSKLTKGLIDTFTTIINSANGKAVWNDDNLEFIEIDNVGSETGKRLRLTPSGLGISKDSGQTYVTAITGEGILANRIIVSDTHALETADTYTSLGSSGLRVFDDQNVERVLIGYWKDGGDHFGLLVRDETGQKTILDERGLIQTWQEGRADNVDATHPLTLYVYLPDETRVVNRALLRFRLLPFRAYSRGTGGGGGGSTSTTSGSSSSTTTGPSGDIGEGASGWYTTEAGDPPHKHQHWLIWPIDHDHNMDHTHTVTVYGDYHYHGIDYGIYQSTSSTNIGIVINNVDRTLDLGSSTGFNMDVDELDITDYLVKGQWNTIDLTSSRLGRIDATVFVQALLGVS